MKTYKSFLVVFSILCLNVNSQNYISNIYDAMAKINPNSSSYTFSSNSIFNDSGDGHIQGIAYYNGFYYIVRNCSEDKKDKQILIVDENNSLTLKECLLDSEDLHPGGIGIYNNILVVIFENKLNFYQLLPNYPSGCPKLIKSISGISGICVGMTDYLGSYLVAIYEGSRNTIRFILLDSTFEIQAEQIWSADNQIKTNWYPSNLQSWQDKVGKTKYENMGLLKEQENIYSQPNYYLFMYHNDPEAIDLFCLNGLSQGLNEKIDIQMVYRLNVIKNESIYDDVFENHGFRMGGGFEIIDQNHLRFFSTKTNIEDNNTLYTYNLDITNPWKLTYECGKNGIIPTIAMDDNGNCVEMHLDESSYIYYRFGKIDYKTNKINWGNVYNTYVKANFVSVDINNNGYCVSTYRKENELFCKVGKINPDLKTISWGSGIKYNTGGNMSVAINNNNKIVEVHQGYHGGTNKYNHYYLVGSINTYSNTVSWINGMKYDTGGSLSISLDDNGNCMETHLGNPSILSNRANRYYLIGKVNFSTGIISWNDGSTLYDTGGNGDIAISSNGTCLEVHRGSPYISSHINNHYYKLGKINYNTKSINWTQGALFNYGEMLSCTLDENDNAICIFTGINSNSLQYRILKDVFSDESTIKYLPTNLDASKYSIGTKSEQETSHNKFYLTPNPASTYTFAKWISKSKGEIIFEIYDLSGKIILKQSAQNFESGKEINNKIVLPKRINKGMYIVYVKENGNIKGVSKLIIN